MENRQEFDCPKLLCHDTAWENVLFIFLSSLLHSKYHGEVKPYYRFGLVKGRLPDTKQESYLKSTPGATVC